MKTKAQIVQEYFEGLQIIILLSLGVFTVFAWIVVIAHLITR